MRRVAALIGCVVLLCALAPGCRKTPLSPLSSDGMAGNPTVAGPAAPIETLTLAFNRDDTLNPYAAATQLNLYLSTLLYDALVRLDDSFMPSPLLAQTVQVTDATHLTVTLRKNAVFSDGSAITAEDVVYAFQKAKASGNYRTLVANFSAAAAQKSTVVFTLNSPDPHAASCLIFPIIKRPSDTSEKAAAPIGSGPYVYNAESETLTLNPKADTGGARFLTIALKTMVSGSEVLQGFESGGIHYLFDDLSDGNIPRTTANDMVVDQNQLVYLGVNTAKPLLSSPEFRKAVSAALDRTVIASSAYTGRARPAITPFHPLWRPASGMAALSANQSAEEAQALLQTALSGAAVTAPTDEAAAAAATTATTAAAGEPDATGDAAETTPTDTDTNVSLSLLYPSGNSCREAAAKLIIRQLASIGVAVTAVPVSYSDYLSRLSAGDYDLYIGEIRLSPNMNLQVFFHAGGAAAYGVPTAGTAALQYAAWRSGEASLSDFIHAFAEEMPYIPLCWRQGMAAYHRSISTVTPSAYNVFDGILQWQ